MTVDAQVIVVGAGPAGSALAARLAGAGREVLLLDQARFPRAKACGEYLSPGAVAALDRLGAAPDVLAQPHRRHRAMELVGRHGAASLAYADRHRALGIQRLLLDDVLRRFAEAAGARAEQGARVVGVLREGPRVAGVRLRDGRELRAEVVVGADGLHSTVARALGLDLPTRWPRRLGLIAHYELSAGTDRQAEMYVGDDFYCGLNPVGGAVVNVGLVGRMTSRRPSESVAGYFERRISALPRARVRLADARRISPIRGVGPLARRVRSVAGPGFLLVGDAAGFFDPFTGEGIHRALRGAELAATGIDTALGRWDRMPIGYDEARRRAFRDKELLCVLVQLFLLAPRALDYTLRRLAARPDANAALAGALGDYAPARPALTPARLSALLRP